MEPSGAESLQLEEHRACSSIVGGLLHYDRQDVEKEFERQENMTLVLSQEEFHAAVNANNYSTIFASLRSNGVPDVDFPTLFLDAARRGKRDVALLLATRVPDLALQDCWGDNALTIAARLGDICFAYKLLMLGAPLNQRNSGNETPREVAAYFKHKHFLKFLNRYEKQQKRIMGNYANAD